MIGLILGGTAAWLAYETKSLLIGESANKQVEEGIRAIIQTYPEVDHLNELLTMHMGPNFILANCSIGFRNDLPAIDMEKCIARLDTEIKQQFPNVKRIFIEAESRYLHLSEQQALQTDNDA
jgi:divalent metal cation (Fe/Co/Zn/Cd) transporter